MAPVATRTEARRPSLAYPALLALSALDAVGYSVIAPVAPAISRATGAGPALIGALVAAFPAGILIGFPLAGRAVQRRKPPTVIALSLALMGLGCMGFVLGDGLSAYFPARLLMGIGSGGLWIGITFGTLERWPGQEYLCMSRIFAAYSIGSLIGPALGAIGGVRGPFLAYLGLVCAGLVLVRLMGPSPEHRPFRSDRSALRLPGFWLSSAGIAFAILALGTVEGVLPLHLAERLSQGEIGALYVGMSLAVAAGATAAGRFRPRVMLLGAIVTSVAGLSLVGATDALPLWIAALFLVGIGVGIGETGSMGLLLDAVSTERIVTAMVVWSQLSMVGYLAGPLVGGAVVQALGFAALGAVPFAAGVGLLVLAQRASRAT